MQTAWVKVALGGDYRLLVALTGVILKSLLCTYVSLEVTWLAIDRVADRRAVRLSGSCSPGLTLI